MNENHIKLLMFWKKIYMLYGMEYLGRQDWPDHLWNEYNETVANTSEAENFLYRNGYRGDGFKFTQKFIDEISEL